MIEAKLYDISYLIVYIRSTSAGYSVYEKITHKLSKTSENYGLFLNFYVFSEYFGDLGGAFSLILESFR